MNFLHLCILAVVQGITEFLPVSSSAHLILVPKLLDIADQGLLIDVGAHAGTLLAVMAVFYRDIWAMIQGGFDVVTFRKTQNRHMVLCLVIATIPCAAFGFAILNYQETLMRHIPLIIISNIIWAFALWWADRSAPQDKTLEEHMTWRKAVLMGLAQTIALVPGTSRSGITVTMARYLGFSRVDSARLSVMMGVPIILGAVLAILVKLIQEGAEGTQWNDFAIVAGLSFVTASITLVIFMRWLRRFSFTPFVIYRFILAAFLLFWFYS